MICSTIRLLDMLLAREVRCQTTVFAGVVNVTQRITRLALSRSEVPKRKFLGPSRSKTVCFLFSVLSYAERSSFVVHLDFVALRHSILVLFSVVSWQLGHRRSCHCTEAVGHPPFSVPSE